MLVNLTIPLSRKLCSCLTIILVWCWHKFRPWIYGITQMSSCRIAYYLRKSSSLNSLILASTKIYFSDVDFFWLVLPGPHWVLFLPLLDATTWFLVKLDAYALLNWLYAFFTVFPWSVQPETELRQLFRDLPCCDCCQDDCQAWWTWHTALIGSPNQYPSLRKSWMIRQEANSIPFPFIFAENRENISFVALC